MCDVTETCDPRLAVSTTGSESPDSSICDNADILVHHPTIVPIMKFMKVLHSMKGMEHLIKT